MLSRIEKVRKPLKAEHCYEMKNYISHMIDHAQVMIFVSKVKLK